MVFAYVAASASRNKIGPHCHAPLDLWNYMVERDFFRLIAAVGAVTIPSVDDLASKAVFGDTFGNKLRTFNFVGHLLLGKDRE